MVRTPRYLALFLCLSAGLGGSCRCAGPGSGPEASLDDGKTRDPGGVMVRGRTSGSVNVPDGDLDCEPGPGPIFQCTLKTTGEPWHCKGVGPGGESYYCAPVNQGPTPPPCEDQRAAGDHVSGLQCWAPPENYCKDGLGDSVTWYCKQDATGCCRVASSDCFLCGWVDMASCRVAGEVGKPDQSLCAAIRSALPPVVAKCLETDGKAPDCKAILEDPGCAFDPTVPVCPGP